jgi:HEPN domain-containing protein
MRQMTKKAELFDKAIGDLWTAKQIYKVRPDYAIYHCAQCLEKTLKGIMLCFDKDYDHTHDLNKLLTSITFSGHNRR